MNTTDRLRKTTTDFTFDFKNGWWIAIPRTLAARKWCEALGVNDLANGSPYLLRALIEANEMTVEG